MMSRALAILALLIALLPGVATAQDDCSFQNGFKAIADQIPEIVGQCVSNEYGGGGGTVRQMATGGDFIWRASDNTAMFITGRRTWVLGPSGLEEVAASPPPAQPPASAAAAPAATSQIQGACYTAVANLRSIAAGYGITPNEQAYQAWQQFCQQATVESGPQGYQCSYAALANGLAQMMYAGGTSGAQFAGYVNPYYAACVAGGGPPQLALPPPRPRVDRGHVCTQLGQMIYCD